MRELLQTSLRSVACQSHSPPFSDSDRSGSNPPPVRQLLMYTAGELFYKFYKFARVHLS